MNSDKKQVLESLLQEGKVFRQEKNRQGALKIFAKAYTEFPNSLQVIINYIPELNYAGKVDESKNILNEYQLKNGTHFFCQLQLAIIELEAGAYELTEDHLELCEELAQNDAQRSRVKFVQARLYKKAGHTDLALKAFLFLEKQEFNLIACLSNITSMLYDKADFKALDALILKHQNLFVTNSRLVLQHANYLIALGEFGKALGLLNKIESESPQRLQQVLLAKSKIHLLRYEFNDSLECLKKVMKEDKVNTSVYLKLARNYIALGEVDEAQEVLREATAQIQSTGKTIQPPLKGHAARLVNQIKSNPKAHLNIKELHAKPDSTVSDYVKIVKEHPFYFGAALAFLNVHFNDFKFQYPAGHSAIPKRIVQYWNTAEVPASVKQVMESWKRENPSFDYELFDYSRAYVYLKVNYGREIGLKFKSIKQPATQADFFRLAYLAKEGGVYVDADDFCRQGIDQFLNKKAEIILLREDFGAIANNFIACVPQHQIIEKTFDLVLENLSRYNNEGPWFSTGPAVLTSVTADALVKVGSKTGTVIVDYKEFRSYVFQDCKLNYKLSDTHWKGKDRVAY